MNAAGSLTLPRPVRHLGRPARVSVVDAFTGVEVGPPPCHPQKYSFTLPIVVALRVGGALKKGNINLHLRQTSPDMIGMPSKGPSHPASSN